MNEDRLGYTHLAPLLLERGSGNVYARDLQARDSLMTAAVSHASRSTCCGGRARPPDSAFEWLPLKRDSLDGGMAEWRAVAMSRLVAHLVAIDTNYIDVGRSAASVSRFARDPSELVRLHGFHRHRVIRGTHFLVSSAPFLVHCST